MARARGISDQTGRMCRRFWLNDGTGCSPTNFCFIASGRAPAHLAASSEIYIDYTMVKHYLTGAALGVVPSFVAGWCER